MSWTEQRVTMLRKMWSEGKTAAEIAKELGDVTRNAVIGKAHRLKLSNRVSPIQQNNKKPVRANDAGYAPAKAASAIFPVFDSKSCLKGVSLAEMKDRMCRWPIGDPKSPDFIFCGGPSEPGHPYCLGHAKIAYQAPGRQRVLNADELTGGTPYEDAEDVKEAVA